MRVHASVAPVLLLGLLVFSACQSTRPGKESKRTEMATRLAQYTSVRLSSDLESLTEKERKMIPLLIQAAQAMDPIYWQQTYGDPTSLLEGARDPDVRRFLEINYGPWDRLADNEPVLPEVGPKPAGANFYPHDMTREEFEEALKESPEKEESFKSLYTLIRRESDGHLVSVPYHEAFQEPLEKAGRKLLEAAELAEDPGLRHYLESRAHALVSDDYRPSDMAWMEMKDNVLDVVIGPIETYEDQLFGYKAAAEAFVLVKDREWSRRLTRYVSLLPSLQEGLPVEAAYKREVPGTGSDLNAYDVIYTAGDANAGSKTIAINLPNDEVVQLTRGTRRLQLKNAMRAKFDKILVPIAGQLIAEEQRSHVTFDAFFANTMFHEVAHGLGIKKTLDGRHTVREALKEQASALEEGKADVLGLYMVGALNRSGEIKGDLEDNYVTFLASIFRSIRFGATEAHGRANLVRFNFFQQRGAFTRDAESGTYLVDFEKMGQAVDALSARILRLQGNGDYQAATRFMEEMARIGPVLEKDLERLVSAGIPVDIVFDQGLSVLGLGSGR
ncbi:MAG: Zn-dependent hydrolase [Acidobacteriota bacterium]